MRDPLTWSLPLGRMFGITVRLHLLFPLVALGLILRVAFNKDYLPGTWVDMSMIMGLLLVAVLLHEFGHCLGARLVEGDAHEVLLWPLGGLAYVDVPHTPRANFITTLMGPLTNLVLCAASLLLVAGLTDFAYRPGLDPFTAPTRTALPPALVTLYGWGGSPAQPVESNLALVILARFFWVNWIGFLLNVLLLGYPLDGGRLFQSVLWRYVGYRQATLAAVFAGFVTMFAVGLYAMAAESILALCLALFIYVACRQQWIILETGGEESLFGYDFSQGYTSLERDQPPPRRRPTWWQRWLKGRAARELQRQQERREADERRMDELLEKIQREGRSALTDEEHRFLKRVSDRYRNRH